MTRKLLVLAALQLVGFGLFAQQQTSTTRPAQQKPVKLHAATSQPKKVIVSSNTPKDSLEGETLAHVNAVIKAIDHKVAYVKSDQSENQKAIETGWYDKMAEQRAIFVAKREVLLQRENETK